MTFNGQKVSIWQDFTANRDLVNRTLTRLSAEPDPPTAYKDRLTGMQEAVQLLTVLPGKKAMVYFTNGAAPDAGETKAALDATIALAVKANVAFYPVDARGVISQLPQ